MFGVLKDSAYFVNTLNFSFNIFSNPILKIVFEEELESESLSVAFQKFLKPSEIVNFLDDVAIELDEIKGFSYNILTRKWLLSNDISQNYIICFKNHLQK